MPLAQPFEQPKPLRDFLSRLSELPRHIWLYIPESVADITPDTPCYATTFNSHDLSPEEQEEFAALAERTGMRCFFFRDQLEDIRSNLKLQCPDFTPEQFITAIDYYWRHDAFIEIGAPEPPPWEEIRRRLDLEFYDKLGPEDFSRPCKRDGCCRGAIRNGVLCKRHHFEMIQHRECPFDH